MPQRYNYVELRTVYIFQESGSFMAITDSCLHLTWKYRQKKLFPTSQKTLFLNYKEHVTAATYRSSGSFELRTQSAPTIALFYILRILLLISCYMFRRNHLQRAYIIVVQTHSNKIVLQ